MLIIINKYLKLTKIKKKERKKDLYSDGWMDRHTMDGWTRKDRETDKKYWMDKKYEIFNTYIKLTKNWTDGRTHPGHCKMSCRIYPIAFSMGKHVQNKFYKTVGYIKLLDICTHTLIHTEWTSDKYLSHCGAALSKSTGILVFY